MEGLARVLGDIEIRGNDQTSPNLIRTQVGLPPGTPVSSVALSRARNNLYATGAYSLVDIDVVPLPADVPAPVGLDSATQRPVRLVTTVREVQPYQFRYGGFYDTERAVGGVVDFFVRNKLGAARVLGFHGRYDQDVREGRVHINQPMLLRFPVKSTAAAFFTRERIDAELETATGEIIRAEGAIINRRGFSIQLEHKFRETFNAAIGYRVERTKTFTEVPTILEPEENLRVAPLTASLSHDSRDNPLDASKGIFTSHSAEWATARLGSQSRYAKYFGQFFQYFPLSEPSYVPWSRETRSRFVAAFGLRLGVGKGLGGGTLPRSERFFAGGATTVRGFEQNFLGPIVDVITPEGFTRRPLGGDAMFVGNAELRFPVYGFVDAVAFADAGNVFPLSSDLRFSNVRYSSGLGLRLRTPYVLIRVDYGVKLDRLPGERLGKFFFSIGQAF
jgi:outer membrane protein assembly factor BamA